MDLFESIILEFSGELPELLVYEFSERFFSDSDNSQSKLELLSNLTSLIM